MKTLASKKWVQDTIVLVGNAGGEARVDLQSFRALLRDWIDMHARLEAEENRMGKKAKR